jgi:hypothetical protein
MSNPQRSARLDRDGVEDALVYLAESAKDYAEARGLRIWLEAKLKTYKSAAFLQNEGSVAEREARAYVSPEYQNATDALKDAVVTEEKIRALRVAAEARVSVWRTLEATKRSENV